MIFLSPFKYFLKDELISHMRGTPENGKDYKSEKCNFQFKTIDESEFLKLGSSRFDLWLTKYLLFLLQNKMNCVSSVFSILLNCFKEGIPFQKLVI